MKLKINKEFFGSYTGLLRWAIIGVGGAVFGTLANNFGLLERPTGHVLMWVSVFAWIISVLTLLTGSLSMTIFPADKEACWNIFFAFLYLVTGTVYGGFEIKPPYQGVRPMAILIFIYAIVAFALYLTLAILQYASAGKGNKKPAMVDEKNKLMEENKQTEGVSSAVVENGKDEEADVEKAAQPQQEEAA